MRMDSKVTSAPGRDARGARRLRARDYCALVLGGAALAMLQPMAARQMRATSEAAARPVAGVPAPRRLDDMAADIAAHHPGRCLHRPWSIARSTTSR